MLLTIHRIAGQIRRVKKDLLGQAVLSTALVAIYPHTFSCLLVNLVLWFHKIIGSPAFRDCFDLFSCASSRIWGMSGISETFQIPCHVLHQSESKKEGWFSVGRADTDLLSSVQAVWLLFLLWCLEQRGLSLWVGFCISWDSHLECKCLQQEWKGNAFHLSQQFGVIWDLIYSPVEREREIKPASFFRAKLFLAYPRAGSHKRALITLTRCLF